VVPEDTTISWALKAILRAWKIKIRTQILNIKIVIDIYTAKLI